MKISILLAAGLLVSACQKEQVPSQEPTFQPAAISEAVAAAPATSAIPKSAAETRLERPLPEGLVSIADLPGVELDLRYRTTNNFMGENLYREYSGEYLHRDAAEKLRKAALLLNEARPGWRLRVLDALRPREIQQRMWATVKGTSSSKYVADPREGSGHNYGMSVDVTLLDEHGKEADMGTDFDDFTPLAQPRNEALYLRSGKLTREQYDNRQLLRRVMRQAGFGPLLQEWWHFNARGIKTIKSRYQVIEKAF